MRFVLERPEDEAAALRLVAGADRATVAVLAGGTDLLNDIEEGRSRPARVISLARLPWRELETDGGELRIGALRPLREIEKRPGLENDLPGFSVALRAVGSAALRTRATLGGNIGRSAPASDLLPILLALGATVELRSEGGSRRVPIAELLSVSRGPSLGPGELVRAIRLPRQAPSAYVWQRVRPSNDVSQVGVAVARPSPSAGWRIALGGIGPVPQRLGAAEAEVAEPELSDDAIGRSAEAAARTAPFRSDRRATEAYRRVVVRVLTARALRAARPARAPGGPSA